MFSLSSMSFEVTDSEKKFISIYSIIYHFFAFFFLALFLHLSVIQGKNKQYIPFVIVAALLFGLLDEIHQFFVIGRDSSIEDVFVDSAGILFASLMYMFTLNKNNNI